jgi:ribose 5-phosphate isomerase
MVGWYRPVLGSDFRRRGSGSRIGLGDGSSMAWAIRALGSRPDALRIQPAVEQGALLRAIGRTMRLDH